MPEVTITIGSRDFEVACQEGEEHFLRSAAALLDAEASVLVAQVGRIPSERMLLMAALMLADKTASLEDKLRIARVKGGQTVPDDDDEASVDGTAAALAALAEIAARAEALAERTEEAVGS